MQQDLFGILSVLSLIVGAGLLGIGLAAPPLNNRPYCRRCRYDLSGIDMESADAKCPECGGALAARRAIRHGLRSRMRVCAPIGALFVLLGSGPFAAASWNAATNRNWNKIKPAWLLERQIDSELRSGGTRVLGELANRAADGRLKDDRLARLGELSAVKCAARTWNSRHWSTLISAAWRGGHISDETMLQYAESAITVVPTVGWSPGVGWSNTFSGDRFSFYLTTSYCQTTYKSKNSVIVPAGMALYVRVDRVHIDGVELAPANETAEQYTSGFIKFAHSPDEHSVYHAPTPVPPGEYEIAVELSFELRRANATDGDPAIVAWKDVRPLPVLVGDPLRE